MSRRKNSRSRGGNGRHGGRGGRTVFPQVTGKVQMTREGFAFVIAEGEEDDVFVKASKTRGALNGDIVRVTVTREKTDRTRREGEVVEIIERSRRPFIGILHVVGDQAWVLMQSRFMPYDISIPFAESDKQRYRRHKVKGHSFAEPKDETGWLKPIGDNLYAIHGVHEMTEDGQGSIIKSFNFSLNTQFTLLASTGHEGKKGEYSNGIMLNAQCIMHDSAVLLYQLGDGTFVICKLQIVGSTLLQ